MAEPKLGKDEIVYLMQFLGAWTLTKLKLTSHLFEQSPRPEVELPIWQLEVAQLTNNNQMVLPSMTMSQTRRSFLTLLKLSRDPANFTEPLPPVRGVWKRVGSEEAYLRATPTAVEGFCLGPVTDACRLQWLATILGPEGSPYEGGAFLVQLSIPIVYPFKPPKVYFLTPIYHPNIGPKRGLVNLDIFASEWSPALMLHKAVHSIKWLMAEPTWEEACENPEAANLRRREGQAASDAIAKEWTRKHAF